MKSVHLIFILRLQSAAVCTKFHYRGLLLFSSAVMSTWSLKQIKNPAGDCCCQPLPPFPVSIFTWHSLIRLWRGALTESRDDVQLLHSDGLQQYFTSENSSWKHWKNKSSCHSASGQGRCSIFSGLQIGACWRFTNVPCHLFHGHPHKIVKAQGQRKASQGHIEKKHQFWDYILLFFAFLPAFYEGCRSDSSPFI